MKTKKRKRKIIGGYKVGGSTWISECWNRGTLTRKQVKKELAEWKSEIGKSDEEIIAELRRSEEDIAWEAFKDRDEDDPRHYEEFLQECIERERESVRNELGGKQEVADALQNLFDKWTDRDDGRQFELVCNAHAALDGYCRAMDHGEF
jgi:hypothetical protein